MHSKSPKAVHRLMTAGVIALFASLGATAGASAALETSYTAACAFGGSTTASWVHVQQRVASVQISWLTGGTTVDQKTVHVSPPKVTGRVRVATPSKFGAVTDATFNFEDARGALLSMLTESCS